ncbi:hypothetical protein BH09SUM1_BH09SUM1_08730 [soil metagenome]
MLGEICRIRTGKKDVNQGNPNGEFPFFTCAAQHTFSDTYSFDTEALLVAGNGDVGKVSYYNGRFEAYQRTYIISDFVGVEPRFLFHILEGKLRETVSKQKLGNTMPYIKVGMLSGFQLPVPPLPEQRRIVGILDKAFEAIATAKANAEKNLENARAVFESELQSAFTKGGKGWIERQLGEISWLKNGLNFNQRSKGQSVRIVGVGDFGQNHIVPLTTLNSVTIDDDLEENYRIREHDILTVRSNGSKDLVGRCLLVPKLNEIISYSGFVIRIRPDIDVVVPRLLLHFMKCGSTRDQLMRGGGGANISNINQAKLSMLMVSLPPLKYQQAIADKLDRIMEESSHLESIYQRKLAALEELKKSLLHQAFAGEL